MMSPSRILLFIQHTLTNYAFLGSYSESGPGAAVQDMCMRTIVGKEVRLMATQKMPKNLKPRNLGKPVKTQPINSCKVQQDAGFGPVAK